MIYKVYFKIYFRKPLCIEHIKTMNNNSKYTFRQIAGFFLSPLILSFIFFTDAPQGLSTEGWKTAIISVCMGVLWLTEAIPIPVTALLPLILFPLFQVAKVQDAAIPYSNPLVFLFLGGFVLALSMEKWNLHLRVALHAIRLIGTSPTRIIAGFFATTAFISMWASNTATTLMMVPIGISIIKLVDSQAEKPKQFQNFSTSLMLSIAYGGTIGGIGTLIGTPPNALLSAFLNQSYKLELGFGNWMLIGFPLLLISSPLFLIMLTKVIFPLKVKKIVRGEDLIRQELNKLGKISKEEIIVGIVFSSTALLWFSKPYLTKFIPFLSDASIAILGALTLFFIPTDFKKGKFIMDWQTTSKIPWGVLLLFGGGLSLASFIDKTGLAKWMGENANTLLDLPLFVVMFLVTAMIMSLSELTSNTATTAAFLPIVASISIGMGYSPETLAIPATLGASCAFMLPVGTPPNAIVYATGYISIPQMVKGGFWLNVLFAILITILSYFWVPVVW